MIFYTLLFVFLFSSPLLINVFLCRRFPKKKFFRFLESATPFLILFIVCVIKSDSVGNDTAAYSSVYVGETSNKNFEFGFNLLMSAFQNMKLPFKVFQIFCYVVIIIPILLVTLFWSPYKFMTPFLFASWIWLVLAFSGLRQSMAVSLCLLSMVLVRQNHIWKKIVAFALFLLACSFHIASLVFVLALLISFFREQKYLFLPIVALFFILFFFSPYLVQFIYFNFYQGNYVPGEQPQVWELSILYLTICLFFICFSIFEKPRSFVASLTSRLDPRLENLKSKLFIFDSNEISENDAYYYLNVFLVGVAFITVARTGFTLDRISYSMLIAGILAIPLFISRQKSITFRIVLIAFFSIMFFAYFVLECYIPNYLHCHYSII